MRSFTTCKWAKRAPEEKDRGGQNLEELKSIMMDDGEKTFRIAAENFARSGLKRVKVFFQTLSSFLMILSWMF
jgi:hypothetical protein